nr:tyrosinase family protein [uncultured Noviherbaspirillum sp.]
MIKQGFTRRDFIKGASALMLPSLASSPALAQASMTQRQEWSTFRTSRHYSSLVNAIATMKENTNPNDKRSWTYWVNVHVNFCPHGVPYFLAWHRGYLYYLEQQLRAISGNRSLVLPYWDYYVTPELPAEFTNPSPLNPLYVPRLNTNVISALTLAPFAGTVTNMQRGLTNSFETLFENNPHNPVHNIIGNVMADMQSPIDPIFFLHHANVDRLWSAWQQAGGGRTTPLANNSYWNGSFSYATRLTMQRSLTIDTRSRLLYNYQNETMPSTLPVASNGAGDTSGFRLAAFNGGDQQLAQLAPRAGGGAAQLVSRPGVQGFNPSRGRMVGPNRLALGGVLRIPLDESSVSAQFAIDDASADTLRQVLTTASRGPATPYRSAQVVLDSVSINDPGRNGGYFYYVYLNLPSSTDLTSANGTYLLGSIGPFEIAGATHRVHMNIEAGGNQPGTVRLVFPVTMQLADLLIQDPRRITVSFVRVSGNNSPGGQVIQIGEARLELSPDAPL